MEGLFTEIIGSIIDRASGFVVGQVAHSNAIREFKAKHKLSKNQNDFLDVYAEAVVAYFQEEKHQYLKQFFRNDAVINGIFDHWYSGNSDLPFYPSLSDLARHFTLAEQLGSQEQAETAIAAFEQAFRTASRESMTTAQKSMTDTLNEMAKGMDRIQAGPGGEIPQSLTQDPFFPKGFRGREDELQELHDKLFSTEEHFIFLVNGKGGIGKTSIASIYYHRFKDAYEHVAWVLSRQSIADALLSLEFGLGLELIEGMTEAQRLDRLFFKLTNLKKPSLLVIDNANEPKDLHRHFARLGGCSNLHILLTTRITEFEEANFYPIEGLPEDEAIALFKDHYKDHDEAEDELLLELIEGVGYNTLLIELFAKNLAAVNKLEQQYALADLIQDVKSSLVRLSTSKEVSVAYRPTGGELRTETPEAIVLAMYDTRNLSEAEKEMISVMAVLPNEKIPFQHLKMLLPEKEIGDALESLAQKGWIDFNSEEKSFRINQVVQDVVLEKHKERLLQDCKLLIDTLSYIIKSDEIIHHEKFALAEVLAGYGEAIIGLEVEPDTNLTILCQNLGNFHIKTGDLMVAMDAYSTMLHHYEGLIKQEPENTHYKNNLAISYEKLGETHSSLGNLEKALGYFEDETVLFEELYEMYPQNVGFKNGLAISYSKLGSTHSSLGNLEKALGYFEDETVLFEELYEMYPQNVGFKNGLAISYIKLGETHSSLGNLEKALGYFEDETVLFEELYEMYPQNVGFKNGLAISYEKLGSTHSSLGNLEKALGYFEERSRLGKELYELYPQNVGFKNGLAISYEKLGSTHSSLGNLEKALGYFEDETVLFEELYEMYPQNVGFKNGLAISYSKLGSTHSSLRNLEKALAYLEEYFRLTKELYEMYPQNVGFKNGLAISYANLGMLYRDEKKDKKAAKRYFQNAVDIWKDLTSDFPAYAEFQKYYNMAKEALEDL